MESSHSNYISIEQENVYLRLQVDGLLKWFYQFHIHCNRYSPIECERVCLCVCARNEQHFDSKE